jgi:hypothetical protein
MRRGAVRSLFDPDQFQQSRRPSAVGAVVALALLVGTAVFDTLLFRALFDTDYMRWYLDNGDLISIVFVFVTLAWGDLNKLTGLVSAQPMQYLLACYTLGGLPMLGLSALLDPRRKRSGEIKTKDPKRNAGPLGVGLLDEFITMLVSIAVFAAFVLWLLVVVPLQYLVYLVAGAPARQALASGSRAWALVTDRGLAADVSSKSLPMPEGAIESGFSAQPVAFTAAVAAALLFAVSKLVG